MATNVVMPQMGESIAEGTIVRWIKKVGDTVDRDEPLFEISTDKVDAEIPSPAAGVLTEIKVKEGETVPVNSVVAIIGAAARSRGEPAATAATQGAQRPRWPAAGRCRTAGNRRPVEGHAGGRPAAVSRSAAVQRGGAGRPGGAARRRKNCGARSPRRSCGRIAKEHDVDIQQIQGTGISGRVTKDDILGFIESGATETGASAANARRAAPATPAFTSPGENVQIVPMSVMRKKIAEHMVISAHTSPHVYSVYEVNFGRVSAAARQAEGGSTKQPARS